MTTPATPIVQGYGAIQQSTTTTPLPASVASNQDAVDEERVPLIVAFDPQDAYPDVTSHEQKDVLRLMDASIREMKQSGGELFVKIPPLPASEVADMRYPLHPSLRTTYMLCRSFFGKTLLALLVSIVLCCATWYYFDSFRVDQLLTEQEFVGYILPGIVAVVATIGASGPIRHRLWGFARELAYWNQPRKVKNVVSGTVEDQLLLKVATKVDTVHLRLLSVLDQINTKAQIIQSPKERKRYLKVDPTLPEIPVDPDAVEHDLSAAKSELKVSVMQLLQDLSLQDVEGWIPKRLRDAKTNYKGARNGNLFFLFLLQCLLSYGTYWVFTMYFPFVEADVAEPYAEMGVAEVDQLAASTSFAASFALEDYVTTQILVWTLALSLEAYIASTFYVLAVLSFKTSASRTARICTDFRENLLTYKTNEMLKESGIQFLCRDILEFRMEKTKRQLLQLVLYSNRLDHIREAIDADAASVATASTMSSFSPSAPLSGSPIFARATNVSPSAPRDGSLTSRWQNTVSSWREKRKSAGRATRKSFGSSGGKASQQ